MKVFLVAIMSLVYSGDQKDVYIWSNPIFDNPEQCVEWVKDNGPTIYLHLKDEFPGDGLEKLLCVNEDKLKDFLEASQIEQGESI